MNPQIISLIGIFLALALVVAGSLRGISIIILSSAAAFLVAATGGIGLLDGYSAYLEGVAGSVTSMFPLFLGGQLLGCFLEKSGLTEAIANAVIHRSGTRGIVVAVFTVSWLLTFCGINVFVIIFTVYPIACAFFKVGDIPRSLIPACVLGACVSQQICRASPTPPTFWPPRPSASPLRPVLSPVSSCRRFCSWPMPPISTGKPKRPGSGENTSSRSQVSPLQSTSTSRAFPTLRWR